jgi:hypothetical protein
MSDDGPLRGRLHERGEAKAHSARPRMRAAADTRMFRSFREGKEAARNCAPSGGSERGERGGRSISDDMESLR